jgi:putative nucleotidyltransferase with HDIG domain
MTQLDDIEIPLGTDFHVSLPPPAMIAPEAGLKAMLQTAEDLLFVLDETGQVLNCKSRMDSSIHTVPYQKGISIHDILPPTVKRKYDLAAGHFRESRQLTLFESMLMLPPSAVNWYEFRLIPAFQSQTLLFIWNVNQYRGGSWTVSNLPVSVEKMLEGWSHALYLRDFETEDHTRRVTETALRLARLLGLPDADMADIRRGAQVHDIGKIAIPDTILLKTGELSKDEWNLMRQHTEIAVEMLGPIPGIDKALFIPRSHHEKWDGSGYPGGLAGEAIPLAARIFAFADVYDALTSDRPYRRAWPKESALDYIRREAGRHFDPHLAPTFFRMMREM